jgi:excisionase family DNA binding protein
MSVTDTKVSTKRERSPSTKRFVDDMSEDGSGEMILTSIELAKYLRVRRNTIYKLLRENKIPGFRVGAEWRFSSRQIDRWIISQQKQERLQAIHA